MNKSVYNYSDYRDFIRARISESPRNGRGVKSALSSFVGCQTTYLSKVLSGKADFNAEQAEAVSRFFKLTRVEKKFFISLVFFCRAGTAESKSFFEEEIIELKQHSLNLKKRLDVKDGLKEKEQQQYYSNWLYAVVHVMSSLPTITSAEHISKALSINLSRILKALDFLQSVGLVELKKGRLEIGNSRLHLPSDSPLIFQHHKNWRIQAMHAVDHAIKDNLHYSSVVTLSKKDAYKVKNTLIESIQSVKHQVRNSTPEEECYAFNIDFFNVIP